MDHNLYSISSVHDTERDSMRLIAIFEGYSLLPHYFSISPIVDSLEKVEKTGKGARSLKKLTSACSAIKFFVDLFDIKRRHLSAPWRGSEPTENRFQFLNRF